MTDNEIQDLINEFRDVDEEPNHFKYEVSEKLWGQSSCELENNTRRILWRRLGLAITAINLNQGDLVRATKKGLDND